MQPMFSIDFGNTYTKVGLRLNSDASSELLTDASLKWDDLNACVPTVAASYEAGGKESWHYGTDVLRFRENTKGLTVYRNWKPRFFESSGANGAAKAVVEPAIAAASSRGSLLAPPGVSEVAWETIKRSLSAEGSAELWEKIAGEATAIAATSVYSATDVTEPIYKEPPHQNSWVNFGCGRFPS